VNTERVGESPAVELPEDFGDSTSWQRARGEDAGDAVATVSARW
jgi:hypothetical protein